MDLQDITKEYKKDKKFIQKVWRAKYAISVAMIAVMFSVISLYNSIDLKKTFTNKTGVEFVQSAQDSIQ